MTYINSYKGQDWLLPTSIKQIIADKHICFFVEEFVDSLDFTNFDMIYDGAGHPAYHPRIIMKIIIQGMLSKERSSRKLANACRENLVFMYLAEKVQPNFRTIARFRKSNGKFIKEVFKETVDLASENGLVDLNMICTDGSTIKANSSKKMCLKKEQIERLDSIIGKMIEEDIQQDEVDKELFGGKEENIMDIEIKNLKMMVRSYREMKNKEKLKENCKKALTELDKDSSIKEVSLSDPECRMMQNKKGFFELDYNVQFTVDSKNQIIVANDVCQDRTDVHQLQPQLKNVQENILLKKDTKVIADCGYSNGESLKFLEEEKLDGYIPNRTQAQEMTGRDGQKTDDYEYDWEKNELIVKGVRMYYRSTYYDKRKKCNLHFYRSRDDSRISRTVTEFFRERLKMKKKMESVEAKKIYNIRKIVVEPVIGNIKYNLGFTEFLVRGLDGAKLELNITSIAHNLKKIWVARGKLSKNNEMVIFDLIITNNQMNCDPACSSRLFLEIFGNLKLIQREV